MNPLYFDDIKVGDKVVRTTQSDDSNPLTVITVTAKRFVCDIGLNQYTGQRMRSEFRKADGRQVGGKWKHFVRRVRSPSDAKVKS
jgi:hypothetical protein